MSVKIVSGGQTGVDQGALEAAVLLGLEFGGWAPARWLAEKPLGAYICSEQMYAGVCVSVVFGHEFGGPAPSR